MAKRQKRDRGRILTDEGYTKIWTAVREVFPDRQAYAAIARWTEPDQDNPNAVTYITAETVSVILNRRRGVDQKSIEHLFCAFDLTLQSSDHTSHGTQTQQPETDPSFVGRERDFAELDNRISQGAKVIVIKAAGGVGKTTLARRYLQQKFGGYLEFPIAKETKDIASVEALLEEKLRQLGEEPGRELMVSLERLKQKLQSESIGILIDNLEPALNAGGQFIDEHRSYVELLRVLANPQVQSVTLITSRERLREPSVSSEHYQLEGLILNAWEEFFQSRNLNTETEALPNLHHAYAGNAKAMELLRGSILEDYSGDVNAYWSENQDDLLVETDLESLVVSQFERLQHLDSNAYKLLIRMGCYRYQDVRDVPIEGLTALLWDIPRAQHRKVVKSLRDRSLIDHSNSRFWLHPVIREKAIKDLRVNEKDWTTANLEAADFWNRDIDKVETVTESIEILEGFFHYYEINKYNKSAEYLASKKSRRVESILGKIRSFGRYKKCIEAIDLLIPFLDEIEENNKAGLLGYLADFKFVVGDSIRAIKTYQSAIEIYNSIENIFDACDNIAALALAYLSMGDYDLAVSSLERVLDKKSILEEHYQGENYRRDSHWMGDMILASTYASLSFANSCLDEEVKAKYYLKLAKEYNHFIRGYSGSWWEKYGNYHFALTLIKFKMYKEAQSVCIYLYRHSCINSDPLAKGFAFRISAELRLSQSKHSKAISKNELAKAIFKRIEARHHLAETFGRIALLSKLYDVGESEYLLQDSISIFKEMEAFKKIEEVQKAYNSSQLSFP